MYSNYFGFTTQPFTSMDNQVLVNSSSYRAAYSFLRQGLVEHRGLLLLTGAAGTGKTTLLRQLIADFKGQARCVLFWNAHLGFDDLLDYLSNNLGLRAQATGQTQKIQALKSYLTTRLAEGQTVVLVLDDAQNLPDQTLAGLHRLARLETAGRRLLQIILSGQPLLETRLAETPALEPLNRNMGGRCRLESFSDDTTIAYIHEHLRAAGYEGGELFETEALDKIVCYGQGIPRLINLICNQALLLAYLNSESRVSAKMVRKVGTDQSIPDRSNTAPLPGNTLAGAPPSQPEPLLAATPKPDSMRSPSPEPPRPVSVQPPPARPIDRQPRPSRQPVRRYWSGFILSLTFFAGAILITYNLNIPLNIPFDLNRLVRSLEQLPFPGDSENGLLEGLNTVHVDELPEIPEQPVPIQSAQGDSEGLPSELIEKFSETTIENPINVQENLYLPVTSEESTSTQPASPILAESKSEPNPAKAERIIGLLSEAEQHLATLRYTLPIGDNALDTYRKVLKLDPDNTQALQGIEHIRSSFLRWAGSARARGDLTRARRHLETALTIDPSDDRARQRLQELLGESSGIHQGG